VNQLTQERPLLTSLELPELQPAVRIFLDNPKRMLIGGKWVDALDGETFATVDPATGETLAHVAEAKAEDINRAVQAARRALEGEWSRMAPSDRGLLLFRLADALEAHADELAQIETLDNGKLYSNARGNDLPRVVEHFRYFAGWCTKVRGETLPTGFPDMHVYTRREPVGVVGAIIAWNFPLSLAGWKLAPALAAGCTVVLKPAEQTPLTALRLGELIDEVGFPPGVVNVCPGFGETAGDALVRHPGVAMITFTGSAEVGARIAAAAAPTLKQTSLELGGKSPNIVFDDADDLSHVAAEAATAIFYESGQVCCAGSRLMVQSRVYDDVVNGMVAHARKLRLGPGLELDATLGPLVSAQQAERVTGFLSEGVAAGATALVGGRRAGGELANGYFVEPTVLTDVSDDMTVCREEIFGPAVVVQPFESLEEVARRANASEYALSAGIWTSDLRKAEKLGAMLDVGTVWTNCYGLVDANVPWGGFKKSGYGKDCGREGLEKFLRTKAIWSQL
jgi:acyl-CoA reductase-like NAD-dependent aldehyde dehydrogenase